MKSLFKILFIALFVAVTLPSLAQKPYEKESAILPPGRNILIQPSLNHLGIASGKIVIDISINHRGDVVSARYNRLRTTIKDRHFIHLCEQAIKEMKFNKVKNGPDRQSGSLTYWFK